MAFPSTAILDDFNRADENPLSQGGTWSGPIGSADSQLKVVSNQAAPGANAVSNSYRGTSHGPDCETYCTVTTKPATGQRIALFLRLAELGTNGLDGYVVYFYPEATFTVYIYRIDNAVWTQLGASVGLIWSAGDSLRFEAFGSPLTVYRKASGGSWAS